MPDNKDKKTSSRLRLIYEKLYLHFGSQHWWPADTHFEVIIGAILTQNTSWRNVESAIGNLKREKIMAPLKLYRLNEKKLAKLIRPSGYYNIKAKRIRHFLDFLFEKHSGDIKKMFKQGLPELRQEILSVNGIGPETADSILLYAGNLPTFVVDAYTKRIFSRHKILDEDMDYHSVQEIFMKNIRPNVRLYNEYHALIVRLGKDICKKASPRCDVCPIKGM